MKRLVVVVFVLVALTALAADQLSVQVRQARLRGRPSYLGPATTEVAYGTRLTLLESRGPWRRLRAPDGSEGWLHESALTEKKLKLAAGENVDTSADSDELALAGKGFNEEVENAFKKDHGDIDYAWVDRMAAWKVSPEEAVRFLAAGDVKGGQR